MVRALVVTLLAALLPSLGAVLGAAFKAVASVSISPSKINIRHTLVIGKMNCKVRHLSDDEGLESSSVSMQVRWFWSTRYPKMNLPS